jgi:site-specific DNA recombinase
MHGGSPKSAAIYTRISHDPSGERLGVQRQEADCLEEAKRRGWSVAKVYVDDDLSAFNPKKSRPAYQRLLSDIQLGVRDGVMIWRLDRLHRQPRELEEFIVLCDKHHVALATVTGDVDLSTSQGRLLARAWGAFAAHESEVKGERMARASLDRARRGIVHSASRPYGYRRGGLTVNPNEATVIKEAARRILAGDTLRGIAFDFDRRGIPTTKGSNWQSTTLRYILVNPRIAGLSTYHGEVVGKANWPAIITRPQSERIRALVADPSRRHNDGVFRWYLLKGLVRCGRCGARLLGTPKRRERSYVCTRRPGGKACGLVSIPAEDLEAFIVERVHGRLDAPALKEALRREHISNPQWRKARSLLDAAEKGLARMAHDYSRGSLTRGEWLAARPALLERVDAARSSLMSDRSEGAIAEYVGHSEVLRSQWGDFPGARRHVIVSALVEQIVIWPAKTTRPSTEERALIWWRGEARPRTPRGARQGIAEIRAGGGYVRCAVAGCREPYKASGYCNVHFQRMRRAGNAGEPGRRRSPPYRGTPCVDDGCERAAVSLNRCEPHYRRFRATDPDAPRCGVLDCDRAAAMAGWCGRHYLRLRRHGTTELV